MNDRPNTVNVAIAIAFLLAVVVFVMLTAALWLSPFALWAKLALQAVVLVLIGGRVVGLIVRIPAADAEARAEVARKQRMRPPV